MDLTYPLTQSYFMCSFLSRIQVNRISKFDDSAKVLMAEEGRPTRARHGLGSAQTAATAAGSIIMIEMWTIRTDDA